MSVKFNDIMKKFYEDEMLGIKNEDAPANSVASGGVDMPADAVSKKKQKEIQKKAYDGRTKEARAFMKRMLELKAKRESAFRKSVKEQMDDFGEEYLNEANVDILRKIVKNKQNMPVKMKDGKMKVDLFTASAITQALDKVKPDTRKKMEDIINNGGKSQFLRLVNVVFKWWMIHAFLLVYLLGGDVQGGQPMYFRSIDTCNWYASRIVKRYGNYSYSSLVPPEHRATAYCKPVYINSNTKGLYDH